MKGLSDLWNILDESFDFEFEVKVDISRLFKGKGDESFGFDWWLNCKICFEFMKM